MNKVLEDQPVVFHTRWALSYLAGPMTRDQISSLMATRKALQTSALGTGTSTSTLAAGHGEAMATPASAATSPHEFRPPVLSDKIDQLYVGISRSVPRGAKLIYRSAVVGLGRVHFVDSKSNVDQWRDIMRVFAVDEDVPRDPWDAADSFDSRPLVTTGEPAEETRFAELASELAKSTSYTSFKSDLKNKLYRDDRLTLSYCEVVDRYSQPGETEGDFRVQLKQLAREQRDLEIEKVRAKYGTKFDSLQSKIQTAEHRVETEEEQAKGATTGALISFGTSVLGALFGRKKFSVTNIGRAGTAMRAGSRASQQKADVKRAEEKLEDLLSDKNELEKELEEAMDEITKQYDADELKLTAYEISPRKSDINVDTVALLWLPYEIDRDNREQPAWDDPA